MLRRDQDVDPGPCRLEVMRDLEGMQYEGELSRLALRAGAHLNQLFRGHAGGVSLRPGQMRGADPLVPRGDEAI